MADDGESLESWLNKATNPSNRQEDWEYIMGFCDQINKELEGPQISVRLLAHKIQSPQEWEAMQALTVLEACMKNCGRRFHNEVGKFKFLNELIKVVSPKYLGDRVSDKVKTKVIEMLYTWTVSLPDEAKICEAYQMLKSQGIVVVDPEVSLNATLIPSPSPRPKNPVFDDEKKSKRLAELLKSKKPEDLQEANRLIKNMVKEDEVRSQRATKQKSTLEAVSNSVKLLSEMLAHFSPEDSTEEDKELIKELYNDCDKLRQTVFKLATETEDDDSSLGEILQANDDLSSAINSYKKIVEGQSISGDSDFAQGTQTPATQGSAGTNKSEILIDLVGLDAKSPSQPKHEPQASSLVFSGDLLCGSTTTELQSKSAAAPSAALSLLDEELLSLGLNDPGPVVNESSTSNQSNHLPPSQDSGQDLALFDSSLSPAFDALSAPSLFQQALSTTLAPVTSTRTTTTSSASNFPAPAFFTPPAATASDLPASVIFPPPLGLALTASVPAGPSPSHSATAPAFSTGRQHVSLPGVFQPAVSSLSHNLQDLAMLDLGGSDNHSGTSTSAMTTGMQGWSTPPALRSHPDDSPLLRSLSPIQPMSQASPSKGGEVSLAAVFVPLEAIKPSTLCPVTAYDKNGVRVLLHFASDCPLGRPDVLVMVASMLNTAPQPVRNIVLQAAVPRTMKVKLQPPSGAELAPFNPILPPAAISQVVLLANPLKEKVRMRYKLMFTLGEQSFTEVGEVNDFPPADRWGAL
ncbi:ADP-ribosylation factor-binding protein GGA3 [Xiphophorus maculatus]|uniref:Golgi associated, gamma adaptin ear containing, ARF binding protein 3a n=2 Tax=Xiphophorus maculatus TaxID=8083 RepID=M3ZWW2_XIPMA|nr:ADP-ribosylation factor-binding protein GGA3 [Xiphophorus maculatus]